MRGKLIHKNNLPCEMFLKFNLKGMFSTVDTVEKFGQALGVFINQCSADSLLEIFKSTEHYIFRYQALYKLRYQVDHLMDQLMKESDERMFRDICSYLLQPENFVIFKNDMMKRHPDFNNHQYFNLVDSNIFSK